MIREKFIESRWKMLSDELKIFVLIYLLDNPYFSSLVAESELFNSKVHTNLDRLIDLGSIDANWEEINGKWVRMFYIRDSSISFVRSIIKGLKK